MRVYPIILRLNFVALHTFVLSLPEGRSVFVKNYLNFITMSNLRNSVRLIGFLGTDPEIKTIGEKKKLAKMAIATNDSYKNDKGEKVEETQWHNLVMWDGLATVAEKYLHKGSEVSVEGKLTSRSYTDKEGVKKYFTEILVNDLLMLGKK